jgi:hypothetical protein
MMGRLRRGAESAARDSARDAFRFGLQILDVIPIDELVERIPIERIIERIPIEQLLARVDMNAVLSQIDIEALLQRMDIGRIVNEAISGIDFESLIRTSTASVGSEVRDTTRSGSMHADVTLARLVDRVIRRPNRDLEVGIAGAGAAAT